MKTKTMKTAVLMTLMVLLMSFRSSTSISIEIENAQQYCYYNGDRSQCIRDGSGAICGVWSQVWGCVPF